MQLVHLIYPGKKIIIYFVTGVRRNTLIVVQNDETYDPDDLKKNKEICYKYLNERTLHNSIIYSLGGFPIGNQQDGLKEFIKACVDVMDEPRVAILIDGRFVKEEASIITRMKMLQAKGTSSQVSFMVPTDKKGFRFIMRGDEKTLETALNHLQIPEDEKGEIRSVIDDGIVYLTKKKFTVK